jgi:hypothetical protein
MRSSTLEKIPSIESGSIASQTNLIMLIKLQSMMQIEIGEFRTEQINAQPLKIYYLYILRFVLELFLFI